MTVQTKEVQVGSLYAFLPSGTAREEPGRNTPLTHKSALDCQGKMILYLTNLKHRGIRMAPSADFAYGTFMKL